MTESRQPDERVLRWRTTETILSPALEKELVFEALPLRGMVMKALEQLTPLEEQVLFCRFQEVMLREQTAHLLGLKVRGVEAIEAKALRKLGQALLRNLNRPAIQQLVPED